MMNTKITALPVAPNPPRTAILVLGMHRSGTSALARLLNIMGCTLPAHLMPSASGNERGHWESQSIVELNDEILAMAETRWDDWRIFGEDFYEKAEFKQLAQRARTKLVEEFAESPLFVLKDPRICRIARFWLHVLDGEGISVRIALPIRNPLEVAASLEKRDGMAPAYAALLWLRYVLDAEVETRGRKRHFCSFDQLIEDWPSLLQNLEQSLEVGLNPKSPDSLDEADTFLSKGERHHLSSVQSVVSNPSLSIWLREVFIILEEWAKTGEQEGDYSRLDAVRAAYDLATPLFSPLLQPNLPSPQAVEEEQEINTLQEQLAEVQSRFEKARSALVEVTSEAEASLQRANYLHNKGQQDATKYDIAREELEERQRQVADLMHRLAVAESTLQQRAEEIDQTRAEFEQIKLQASETESQLNGQITSLHEKLKEADGWIFQLAGDRRKAEVELARELRRLMKIERENRDLEARNERLASDLAEERLKSRQHEGLLSNEHHILKSGSVGLESDLGAAGRKNNAEHQRPDARIQALEEELQAAKKDNESAICDAAAERQKHLEVTIALNELGEEKTRTEKSLKTRFDEIAQLTQILRDQQDNAEIRSKQVDWLRQVNTVLASVPAWWFSMPRQWRRKRELIRLKNKGLFDSIAYLDANPDVAANGMDPLQHFILHGMDEGRTW